jgi:hypothetical protein
VGDLPGKLENHEGDPSYLVIDASTLKGPLTGIENVVGAKHSLNPCPRTTVFADAAFICLPMVFPSLGKDIETFYGNLHRQCRRRVSVVVIISLDIGKRGYRLFLD